MKKKLLMIGIIFFVLIIGGFIGNKLFAGVSNNTTLYSSPSLIGTKTGTSTTGVYLLNNNAATSTSPKYIGNDVDEATFTIKAVNSSSTVAGPNVMFSLLGSQDSFCEATTTTVTTNSTTTSQINWFDVSSNIKGASGLTGLITGTTTYQWKNPIQGEGESITLVDLNYRCLAFEWSASSTSLWVQLRTKIK